uniref:Uncharacterized protein n=1 Tax=Arundo donax TaxID=35708 RepID=A0A0A9GA72_ARUDO
MNGKTTTWPRPPPAGAAGRAASAAMANSESEARTGWCARDARDR